MAASFSVKTPPGSLRCSLLADGAADEGRNRCEGVNTHADFGTDCTQIGIMVLYVALARIIIVGSRVCGI